MMAEKKTDFKLVFSKKLGKCVLGEKKRLKMERVQEILTERPIYECDSYQGTQKRNAAWLFKSDNAHKRFDVNMLSEPCYVTDCR
jgi:hypothetical protein